MSSKITPLFKGNAFQNVIGKIATNLSQVQCVNPGIVVTCIMNTVTVYPLIGSWDKLPYTGSNISGKMIPVPPSLNEKVACHCSDIIWASWHLRSPAAGGRFKNTYELLNLRALKFSLMNEIRILQCMGKIFCVEFQRFPLKFHTKYLTHILKDMIFIQHLNFKSS